MVVPQCSQFFPSHIFVPVIVYLLTSSPLNVRCGKLHSKAFLKESPIERKVGSCHLLHLVYYDFRISNDCLKACLNSWSAHPRQLDTNSGTLSSDLPSTSTKTQRLALWSLHSLKKVMRFMGKSRLRHGQHDEKPCLDVMYSEGLSA